MLHEFGRPGELSTLGIDAAALGAALVLHDVAPARTELPHPDGAVIAVVV